MQILKLNEAVYWIGVLDFDLKVFDIIMETEFGTTYNAYLVKGSQKTALIETVKITFFDQYLNNIKQLIDVENIDYIIVNHTEPDHAGSIEKLLNLIPNVTIVGSQAAINFLKEITNKNFNSIIVGTGSSLSLGNKTLKFIDAPFLHWPDSIYTYLEEHNTIFTCDSFGAHYSFSEILFSKLKHNKNDYLQALKYYYEAIFSPFKKWVLSAITKIENLSINMICTGHGPILDKNPREIIDIYKNWSQELNPNETKTIIIPYVSAYGYTETLAFKIKEGITQIANINVKLYKLDIANYANQKVKLLEDIYFADGILFGTSTINRDALPIIWDIVISLNPIVHGNKLASVFGSYGWSGEGVDNILQRLEQLNMKVIEGLKINFKPSESDLINIIDYGKNFAECLIDEQKIIKITTKKEVKEDTTFNITGEIKKWKCSICNEIFEGISPPNKCPACGVGQEMFEEWILIETTYTSNENFNIVIIGNGIAGISAIEAIRERNNICNITLISDDKELSYYRPMLPELLNKEIDTNNFYLKNIDWYKQKQVALLLETKIINIDIVAKELLTNHNLSIKYDKLILAMGAKCTFHVVKNMDLKGLFTLRTLDDLENIKKYAFHSKKVCFIGGGVLALEIAWQLKQLGLSVDIIEQASYLLPKQLDENAANILEYKIKNAGIKVHKACLLQAIVGFNTLSNIELSNGEIINTDMLIFAMGALANKDIAEKAGIHVKRGIIVNDYLQTNIENIYAAGDVAEHNSFIAGLWATALEQGKIAGANVVGDLIKYKTVNNPVTINTMNTEIFSIGDIALDKTKQYEIIIYKNTQQYIYKKLCFLNDKFVGCLFLGDVSKANKIIKQINTNITKEQIKNYI